MTSLTLYLEITFCWTKAKWDWISIQSLHALWNKIGHDNKYFISCRLPKLQKQMFIRLVHLVWWLNSSAVLCSLHTSVWDYHRWSRLWWSQNEKSSAIGSSLTNQSIKAKDAFSNAALPTCVLAHPTHRFLGPIKWSRMDFHPRNHQFSTHCEKKLTYKDLFLGFCVSSNTIEYI
jgi:hypothetical protein